MNCVRCDEAKDSSEFYASDRSCKECRRAFVREHRANNLEKIRAAGRKSGLSAAHKKRVARNYRRLVSTPEGRAKDIAYKRKHASKNPLHRAANIAVSNAIRDKRLVPEPCIKCGEVKVHGHHEDYSKPLDVVWLCTKHHGERHREINEMNRRA